MLDHFIYYWTLLRIRIFLYFPDTAMKRWEIVDCFVFTLMISAKNMSVSYTHLDVYKSQALQEGTGLFSKNAEQLF